MQKKLRIYVETSVISHLDAPDRPDRMGETLLLWKEILTEKYEVVVGDPVIFFPRQPCLEDRQMKSQSDNRLNKFGLEEIRAIRDRWDAMPYEEVAAEWEKSVEEVMTERHGSNWRAKEKVIN